MAKGAKKLILALIVALGTTQAAKSDKPVMNGMKLQQWCFGKENSLEKTACTVFRLGFISGVDWADIHGAKVWCLPDDLATGQTELIVKKFIREHPEDLHEPATVIVGRALYLAYACRGTP
jgi:Rap1a immunity proteins